MKRLAPILAILVILAAPGGAARADIQANADGAQLVQTSGVEAWAESLQTTPSQTLLEGSWGVINPMPQSSPEASITIAPVQLDLSRPTGSFTINSGAGVTIGTRVLLTITPSDDVPWGWGVTRMRLSSDGTAWTDWQRFASSVFYMLPLPNGYKTIYVQLRDGAGNDSPVMQQSIRLNLGGRSAVEGGWSLYE